MAQDLREMFKKERDAEAHRLSIGHKERFKERLENELPQNRTSYYSLMKIAACLLLLIGVGGYFLTNKDVEPIKTTVVDKNKTLEAPSSISLGDLSPDLMKIENYYVTNINLELSRLEVSQQNKALVDSFMEQLGTLNKEYNKLNTELNEIGPNDQTISAMIKNLQLRLQLMQKLKEKLNHLKLSKNETVEKTNI
ncbi:MAG: hypothetical protein HKN31_16140 [Pricia sp.]|nr:hypothetical protein [Pricia sp.]